MKQSKVVLASIGAVLALVAGACGSSSKSKAATGSSATTAPAKASGPPYQVGFDSSLSGTYAANGTGQRSGFTAYIKYVNDHGGVNGHQVNVSVLDDAGDISTATANATQSIAENHVSVTVGYLLSNACGAAATIATAQQVPIICSALPQNLLVPVHPYIYSSRNSQTNEALPMITYAKTLAKSTTPKVAVIIYGSAASSGLQTALNKLVKVERVAARRQRERSAVSDRHQRSDGPRHRRSTGRDRRQPVRPAGRQLHEDARVQERDGTLPRL